MEVVLNRGPWAFADRMLVLQRWAPQMDLEMLNFIPFWIQIRGIPLQFMNQDVIAHIGRAMAMLLEIDYTAEAATRVEYVRVRLNWDVRNRLRFQRNFQFTPGVNTLLRFRYERLRGFCEVCGLLTHDSGNCLIQNGGEEQHPDDDDDDDDDDVAANVQLVPNQGLQIREINDDEDNAEDANDSDEEVRPLPGEFVHEAEEDIFEGNISMLREYEVSELFNPCPRIPNSMGDIPYDSATTRVTDLRLLYGVDNVHDPRAGRVTGKRKLIEVEDDAESRKITTRERGEGSGTGSGEGTQDITKIQVTVDPKPPEST
ncbi:hypothetical protein AALP_AA4G017000 [Arabis alpina]|uniref:Zinc knuckle CX2CX4HX4C domain-containing protein n=1 Tax=Arabis alpina TaxID=50452 RepID=A0A087H0I6_ARAAL|nr:hypothetical protein AALP_AA4G017000 [Arabis alpina]